MEPRRRRGRGVTGDRGGVVRRGERPIPRWFVGLCAALLLGGCQTIGPSLIERDQVSYSAALLEAEKQQLLLNIVRLRYGDIPALVRVDQIVAGYERRVIGSIGSSLEPDLDFSDDFAIRGEGQLADRPTYTIKPLQGADYARFLLRPIPPRELVGLLAGGAHLYTALGLAVERINGVPNDQLLAGPEPPSGRFWRTIALLQDLRNDGLVQIDFEPNGGDGGERVYLSFVRAEDAPRDERAASLIELLELDPTAERYEVVLGVAPRSRHQIALWTRSLIEILSDVANGVDRTPSDPPRPRLVGQRRDPPRPPLEISVAGGPLPPSDTFVRVEYDDRWYWIEQDARWTKRAFSMLLLLTTILERDDVAAGTVLTIPAN
jgi:hypothetical protein